VPSVNPWLAMETLVTRQAPGGGGEVLGEQERITLEQAMQMYTENSARQMGRAHLTGTLEAGKLADLVVVDRNPFSIPITEVHQVQAVMTMIDGEVVYRADP
jgi:predicted amidohydrolase YtcJ